jgi:hypothetical protein
VNTREPATRQVHDRPIAVPGHDCRLFLLHPARIAARTQ